MTAPVQDASADESGDRDGDERTDEERLEGIRRLKTDLAIARSPGLTTLEERLYKHVVDCIDFDALFGFEQMLWHAVDKLGHGALDNQLGLSHRLIQRALTRAAHDPSNTFKEVPYGITKAEQRAVRFDRECMFCEYAEQAAEDASESSEHDHGDDECSLCDGMAREWRAEHADKLRAAHDRRLARAKPQSKMQSKKGSRC